ncbi:hypothetical protein BJ742DRAFT_741474 [Cladochytrium replicatum]|nr:hypothetical protein BJ742DRAFT_741474 [Cladochytrium replicatum]
MSGRDRTVDAVCEKQFGTTGNLAIADSGGAYEGNCITASVFRKNHAFITPSEMFMVARVGIELDLASAKRSLTRSPTHGQPNFLFRVSTHTPAPFSSSWASNCIPLHLSVHLPRSSLTIRVSLRIQNRGFTAVFCGVCGTFLFTRFGDSTVDVHAPTLDVEHVTSAFVWCDECPTLTVPEKFLDYGPPIMHDDDGLGKKKFGDGTVFTFRMVLFYGSDAVIMMVGNPVGDTQNCGGALVTNQGNILV